jgi:hypothetical protein
LKGGCVNWTFICSTATFSTISGQLLQTVAGGCTGSSTPEPEIRLKAILLVLNPATETLAERCAPQVHLFFHGIPSLIRSRLQ